MVSGNSYTASLTVVIMLSVRCDMFEDEYNSYVFISDLTSNLFSQDHHSKADVFRFLIGFDEAFRAAVK